MPLSRDKHCFKILLVHEASGLKLGAVTPTRASRGEKKGEGGGGGGGE